MGDASPCRKVGDAVPPRPRPTTPLAVPCLGWERWNFRVGHRRTDSQECSVSNSYWNLLISDMIYEDTICSHKTAMHTDGSTETCLQSKNRYERYTYNSCGCSLHKHVQTKTRWIVQRTKTQTFKSSSSSYNFTSSNLSVPTPAISVSLLGLLARGGFPYQYSY